MATITKQTLQKNRIRARGSDKVTDVVINVFLVIMCVFAIYPLWYTLIASMSEPAYINTGKVWVYPVGFNVDAYKRLLRNSALWRGYRNTIFYTTGGVLAFLIINFPASFAMSRKFPGKGWITTVLMIPMYIGGGMIPTFLLIKDLGLMNSIWVMIIPHGIAFYYVLITKAYLSSNIPESLFESARIDGASITQYFFRFVIPLSKPILSVLTLYTAIPKWNDYMSSILYIQDYKKHSLQVIIQSILEGTSTADLSILSGEEQDAILRAEQLQRYAIVLVGAVPLMLLYPAVQKFLIGGVMLGAVKE